MIMQARYVEPFNIVLGNSPIVAAAIHHGHFIRPQVAPYMTLGDDERRREEDPFTGDLTDIAPTRLIGQRSRFEFDLNRPRDKAVYGRPEDAWGLKVWRLPLPARYVEHSLAEYDSFYEQVETVIATLVEKFGSVVVLDLHSYNHRRAGTENLGADQGGNPEINIGTGSMNRGRWGHAVDAFISDLRQFDFLGRRLDVRENVKFRGGHFPTWLHQTFPDSVCAIAVECKKFFMDEWTGVIDRRQLRALHAALQSTISGICGSLQFECCGVSQDALADTQIGF